MVGKPSLSRGTGAFCTIFDSAFQGPIPCPTTRGNRSNRLVRDLPVIRRAPKTGTLFMLEELPFEGRRRWYCDLDGADAPSFDDLEEAVIWGLDRAAGVVVRR